MGVINNIFGKFISGLTQNSNAKEKQTSAKKNERLFNFGTDKTEENDLYNGLVSLSKDDVVTDINLKTKTAAQKTYQKGTLEYTLNLIGIEPSIINDAVYNPKGQITDFKIAYDLSSILNNNQQSSGYNFHLNYFPDGHIIITQTEIMTNGKSDEKPLVERMEFDSNGNLVSSKLAC